MTDDDNNESEHAPDEVLATEDRFQRVNGVHTASAAASELLDLSGVDFTEQHDDAWWSERDHAIAELRARELVHAERERMRKRAQDLEYDGDFPKLALEAAMNVPNDTPAMVFAKRFPYMPTRIIVFAGGVGTGKTTAACWLSVRANDHKPGFIRASTLERRGRYDKSLDGWLKDRTSLVIDDLGVEVLDSRRVFASLLDEIVDWFCSRRRVLIMTTNLLPRVTDEMVVEAKREHRDPEPQFVERYGDRVRSRLRQIGAWADCGIVDLRKTVQPS